MKTKYLIFGFLLLIGFAFAFQGQRGLYESTEGRYANVAYNMVSSGDWMHPKLHPEQPHWTKPPMYYWVTALSMTIFGPTTFAVRFPGALAYLITILLVLQLGRIFVPQQPWLAGVIYATFLFPFVASNTVDTDGVLTLFEIAGVSCITLVLFDQKYHNRGLLFSIAGGAIWGLAFLTKGPPALLPLLGIGVWVLFNSRIRKKVKLRNILIGTLFFLVIGGSWYIIEIRENQGLLEYYLKDEVFNRMATGIHKRNSGFWGGFIVYLPTILLGSLPWTIPCLGGIYKKTKQIKKHDNPEERNKSLEDQFLMLWFFIPLIIFMLASSRLPLYILPLFTPLALICARNISSQFFRKKRIVFLLVSWSILLVTLRFASGYLVLPQDSRILADELKNTCPEGITEVVFVDTKPHYGLSLFLNVPIERVSFQSEYSSFSAIETLNKELEFYDPKRVWMVPKETSTYFEDYVHDLNIQITFIEWVKGRKTYGVYLLDH